MVETENFIQEIREEVRKDKLFKALRRYRWMLFGLIFGIILAVSGYEYYKYKLIIVWNGDTISASTSIPPQYPVDSIWVSKKDSVENDYKFYIWARINDPGTNFNILQTNGYIFRDFIIFVFFYLIDIRSFKI